MNSKKIRMLSTHRGSPDGINIQEYEAGQTYFLPPRLAEIFLDAEWAEEDRALDGPEEIKVGHHLDEMEEMQGEVVEGVEEETAADVVLPAGSLGDEADQEEAPPEDLPEVRIEPMKKPRKKKKKKGSKK